MPVNVPLSVGTLLAFLLVLARVSGALTFVPMPGFGALAGPPKVAFSIGFTLALFAQWPVVETRALNAATVAGWAASEAAVGIAIGLAAAVVLEAFTLATQVLGLQAGYAYAQTIDPTTQADSGILLVVAQLIGSMFFFALGFDRQILRLFALSLEKVPAGTWVFGRSSAEGMIHLYASLFSAGVRLALPVVALLMMVDVTLALLGRLNAQLQLLSLAFPVKMLLALLVLSWIAVLFPRILRELAGHSWSVAVRTLGR